jgi:16S rRNA (cytidine1402-2'-O)-methyltransferase
MTANGVYLGRESSEHFRLSTLYVVATPIGNLEDITIRAARILEDVDLIAAEDTRHTSRLLSHLGIRTTVKTYHDHNESSMSDALVQDLKKGLTIALVSDAGTPLISDPGYRLVKQAREAGIDVVPIPGPSALIAALSVAGLPSDRFKFHGFLPAKEKAREDFLKALLNDTGTQIFYESPHRMVKSIAAFEKIFENDRVFVIARELTKTFEQIVYGPVKKVREKLESGELVVKGEFVILMQGQLNSSTDIDVSKLLVELLQELPMSKAAEVASKITGEPRKKLYKLALSLKQD